ncbi:hypothetical protein A3N63_01460 [Klebsiella aerogenes]|nr:hypothetical protein A3N63_01460 [Klebsiella aerogenes]
MRQHPAADIHALTDIKRQRLAFTMELIHPWQLWQGLKPWTQMFGILIDCRRFKFQTRGRLFSGHNNS